MDNIIYGEPLGPRVSTVLPIEDFRLLLTFNTGERRIFDAKPLFSVDVFKPLQSKLFFESVRAAYGSILWPNDIDYCPDTLYAESVPKGELQT
jgi:hypothetical protein